MDGQICLDSSVVISHLRGDRGVSEQVSAIGVPILSSFALAELLVGARLSQRPDENLRLVELFSNRCAIVFADRATLDYYASAKIALRRQGTPIPENDLWIAALCLQHNWQLAFADGHFELVPGLQLLRWGARTSG